MRYDVFCKIVDNFGDAAVCWRLSWQLANEHGHQVRLWLDQPGALCVLRPELDRNASRQVLEQVEVIHWQANHGFNDPGDVVIEGFGCGLPESYVDAMAARSSRSLWIVLEYLSAERWVNGHHGLPSPHPRHDLPRFYFFPGFSDTSGGLIREADLMGRRDDFLARPEAGRRLWKDLGFTPPDQTARTVSLFGYENINTWSLLNAFSHGDQEVVAVVPPSRLRQQVSEFLGQPHHPDGSAQRLGRLEVRFAPFLAQPRYDELLWACDWNFVRGEDSFVRAQWAARPFAWHIYPQDNRTHMIKLDAYLDLYLEGLDADAASAMAGLWRSWNGSGQFLEQYWNALQFRADTLLGHARDWKNRLLKMPDLVTNLANFCSERLK